MVEGLEELNNEYVELWNRSTKLLIAKRDASKPSDFPESSKAELCRVCERRSEIESEWARRAVKPRQLVIDKKAVVKSLRELDLVVAEHIMGWEDIVYRATSSSSYDDNEPVQIVYDFFGRTEWGPGTGYIPCYSTGRHAASKVEDALVNKWRYIKALLEVMDFTVRPTPYLLPEEILAIGRTSAEQRMVAALKSVGIEVELQLKEKANG